MAERDFGWAYTQDNETRRSCLIAWRGEKVGYIFDVPKPEGDPPEMEMPFTFPELLAEIERKCGPHVLVNTFGGGPTMNWYSMELLRQKLKETPHGSS
jgi:hypothetical protein